MMEVARGGPIGCNGLWSAMVVIGLPPRRSGPIRHQLRFSKQHWRVVFSRGVQAAGISWNLSPLVQTAQTSRASLLASATAALL